jgi:hypothetical protein
MSVCCECCVLLSRSLRPEECDVSEYDCEAWITLAHYGLSRHWSGGGGFVQFHAV